MDNMHKIEFSVSTSGSKLFDTLIYVEAQKFCARYPGLDYRYENDHVRIFGELNDYWWDKYNRDQLEMVNFLKDR